MHGDILGMDLLGKERMQVRIHGDVLLRTGTVMMMGGIADSLNFCRYLWYTRHRVLVRHQLSVASLSTSVASIESAGILSNITPSAHVGSVFKPSAARSLIS